jgi:hypothetical protein
MRSSGCRRRRDRHRLRRNASADGGGVSGTTNLGPALNG